MFRGLGSGLLSAQWSGLLSSVSAPCGGLLLLVRVSTMCERR